MRTCLVCWELSRLAPLGRIRWKWQVAPTPLLAASSNGLQVLRPPDRSGRRVQLQLQIPIHIIQTESPVAVLGPRDRRYPASLPKIRTFCPRPRLAHPHVSNQLTHNTDPRRHSRFHLQTPWQLVRRERISPRTRRPCRPRGSATPTPAGNQERPPSKHAQRMDALGEKHNPGAHHGRRRLKHAPSHYG